MRVAIVGAGMAGLACAHGLRERGHAATLFDKGRGAGGRMSKRRVATDAGERRFDHGAQYITAHDPGFAGQLRAWAEQGLVAPWPAAGERAWVGTPAMSAPVRAMADAADVRWNTRVDALAHGDGWRVDHAGGREDGFDAVVIAVPAEQVAALVAPHLPALVALATGVPSAPCWTVMAAFAARVPAEADVIRDAGSIGWAARDSAKPGRARHEAWVIQATPDWSAAHLEEQATTVTDLLMQAFAERVGGGLPAMIATAAHRWRYARSGALGRDALWDGAMRLGVCGDWLLGPRVESAWLSGRRLAALVD